MVINDAVGHNEKGRRKFKGLKGYHNQEGIMSLPRAVGADCSHSMKVRLVIAMPMVISDSWHSKWTTNPDRDSAHVLPLNTGVIHIILNVIT